jgi:hypothetical protein
MLVHLKTCCCEGGEDDSFQIEICPAPKDASCQQGPLPFIPLWHPPSFFASPSVDPISILSCMTHRDHDNNAPTRQTYMANLPQFHRYLGLTTPLNLRIVYGHYEGLLYFLIYSSLDNSRTCPSQHRPSRGNTSFQNSNSCSGISVIAIAHYPNIHSVITA